MDTKPTSFKSLSVLHISVLYFWRNCSAIFKGRAYLGDIAVDISRDALYILKGYALGQRNREHGAVFWGSS